MQVSNILISVFDHVTIYMAYLDDYFGQSSTPTNDSSLQIVTSMQCFTHHGLCQAYSKEKEKVATYILVQWAMIGQDSMHVQHTTFEQ